MNLSAPFREEDNENLDDFVALIHYLEECAEFFCYLDDYKILVVDGSREPIIIMSPEKFMEIEKKTLGFEE